MASHTPHPYYPRMLILDHYVPNELTTIEILILLFSTFGVLILGALFFSYQKRQSSIVGVGQQLTFVWFVLSGFIHLFLEGYFSVRNRTLAGEQTLLAQTWKEYSLSDSRYLSSDSFVVIMETITAFAWGPLAFYTAYAQYADSPARYIAQLILSLGQLYGDILYYLTTIYEGMPHCDPHPYYTYFYFGFFNMFWIIIPLVLIHNSVKNLYRGMTIAQAAKTTSKSVKTKKTN
ncbi:hypothetical protein BGW38_003889 [Lunasporangiospora selenospora]|uniref:EXPERA domain-containing protein n=1 Tax=Lunasporangiospora selenospora TaxID=979761 RepID=A0A9P6FQV0_9FUNG|nr:hypothetical protein BGW38_003889 [Lunasporangiospora selenospora]